MIWDFTIRTDSLRKHYRFEFRIEVNLDAMTHLRIWKPILKNASTLAEKCWKSEHQEGEQKTLGLQLKEKVMELLV
ncbi:hypothetical protein CMV_008128 [Castanea mollissima]|uniref:Uncharacterized protein n=1 Tax=Castanea mollissima TaxID=60419 RepID=A0A8J4RGV6_9ROSI|nr:hypothetical protein CMV_008128 [Castanea mollissima]